MKSFKDYVKTTDADVARQYMDLHMKNKKGSLNPFDEIKLKAYKEARQKADQKNKRMW